MNDVEDFTGNENYLGYSKEPETMRNIVMRAIETCRIEMAKEMTIGGEVTKIINGTPVTLNVPSQRNVVEEAVNSLYDLCVPYFDDTAIKNIGLLEKEKQKAYEYYYNEYLKLESDENLREFAKNIGKIPHPSSSSASELAHKFLDEHLHQITHLIYQELLMLFKRENEFSKRRAVGYGYSPEQLEAQRLNK